MGVSSLGVSSLGVSSLGVIQGIRYGKSYSENDFDSTVCGLPSIAVTISPAVRSQDSISFSPRAEPRTQTAVARASAVAPSLAMIVQLLC